MTQPLIRILQIEESELSLKIITTLREDAVLDDLSDVSSGSPSVNDALIWNGTRWVPSPVGGAGVGGSTILTNPPLTPGQLVVYDNVPGGSPPIGSPAAFYNTNILVLANHNQFQVKGESAVNFGSPRVTGSPQTITSGSPANQTSLEIRANIPGLMFYDNDAAGNEKAWRFIVDDGDFIGELRSDSGKTSNRWLELVRSGTRLDELYLYIGQQEKAIHAVRGAAVELYHNNILVAETSTAATGGLRVNNLSTGAGFERVLTESDLGTVINVGTGDGLELVGSPLILQVDATVVRFAGSPIVTGSPSRGDILYDDGSGKFVRLPIGTSGQVLTIGSPTLSWKAPTGGGGGGGSGDSVFAGDGITVTSGSPLSNKTIAVDATVARLSAVGSPYGSPIGGLLNTTPFITSSDIKLRTLGGGSGDFNINAQSGAGRFSFNITDEDSNDGIILYSDGESVFGFAPGFEASGLTTLRGDRIVIQSAADTSIVIGSPSVISLYHKGIEVGQVVAGTTGGLLIKNEVTGGSPATFERVLTTSDLVGTGGSPTDQLHVVGGDGITATYGSPDVTIAVDGTVLRTTSSLNDLSDVLAGSPTIGAVLYNDGTNWLKLPRGTSGQVLTMGSPLLPTWQNNTGGSPADQLHVVGGDGITTTYGSPDVTVAVDGTVLRTTSNLTDLADVDTTGVLENQVLTYAGSPLGWIPQTLGGGSGGGDSVFAGDGISIVAGSPLSNKTISVNATVLRTTSNLDDLANVVGSPTVIGDTLYFDGTNWNTLARGTAGQVLTMGSPLLPSWKNITGGSPLQFFASDGLEFGVGSPKGLQVDSTVARQANNETITGNWTFQGGSPIEPQYGTGAKVYDGTGVARPVGYNVAPIYEINSSLTFDLAHNGFVYHKFGSPDAAVTLTCSESGSPTTIPQGASWVVHNDSLSDITITAGTGVTINFIASGGAPVAGDVTVQAGGIVTVYKYTDTEYWVWGDSTALSLSLNDLSDASIGSPIGVGGVLYFNGTNWVNLGAGTTGQVLTVGSPGLSWTSIVGGSPVDAANIVGGDGITVTTGSPEYTVAVDSTVARVGDNVSQFVNDANYISSGSPLQYVQQGDNVSVLINDANYISSGSPAQYVQDGDNITRLVNNAGYLTSLGSPGSSANIVGGDGVTVTIGSPQYTVAVDGTVLRTTSNLTDLADVDTTGVLENQVLTYAGSPLGWIPQTVSGGGSGGDSVFAGSGITIVAGSPLSNKTISVNSTVLRTSSNLDDLANVVGSPTVIGDTLYFDGTNWNTLARGTAGQVLTMGSPLLPSWTGDLTLNSLTLTTPLDETDGGTGTDSYTQGDILYASAANTLAKLPIGSAGTFLRSDASIVGWSGVSFANSAAKGDIIYASGTNNYDNLSIGSPAIPGRVLSISATGIPEWKTVVFGSPTDLPNIVGGDGVTVTTGSPEYTIAVDGTVLRTTSSLNDLGDVVAGSPTIGAVLYNDGTNWLKLARGTAGQVLTMGSPLLPKWTTIVGGSPTDQIHIVGGDGITVTTGSPEVTVAVDSTVARMDTGSPVTQVNEGTFRINSGSPVTTNYADLYHDSASGVDYFNVRSTNSVALHYQDLRRLTTASDGNIRLLADDSTGNPNITLGFYYQNGISRRGYIGFAGTILKMRNEVHGQGITLEAEDAGGVDRQFLIADPDNDTEVRGRTTLTLFVGAAGSSGENALVATAAAGVDLYYLGSPSGIAVARTVADTSGGFEVYNVITGAGFERVLTTSDLIGGSPNVAANIVGGDGITVTTGSPEYTIAVDGTVLRTTSSLNDLGDVVAGSPTIGAILYNDGTNWLKLARGTNNQVLTMGSPLLPVWKDAAASSGSGDSVFAGDGITITAGSPLTNKTIAVDATVARLTGSPPTGSPSQIFQNPNTFLNNVTFEINPTTVDGTGVKRPVGLGVFPPYEIDTSATFDTAHAGMVWHVDAGSPAVTFTAPNDSTIEIGSMWQVQNDDVENVTIAQGSPSVTILRLGAGGAPVAGNVLVQQGGIVTIYKYTDTEYWVYGDSEAIGFGSPVPYALGDLTDVTYGSPTLATGDVLYYNGTAWVNLPRGTSGQVLTMGSPLLPKWKSAVFGSPVDAANIVGGDGITITTGSPELDHQ
jgi:hypothetical protein